MADKSFLKALREDVWSTLWSTCTFTCQVKRLTNTTIDWWIKNLHRRITTSEGLIFCDMKFSNTS